MLEEGGEGEWGGYWGGREWKEEQTHNYLLLFSYLQVVEASYSGGGVSSSVMLQV